MMPVLIKISTVISQLKALDSAIDLKVDLTLRQIVFSWKAPVVANRKDAPGLS